MWRFVLGIRTVTNTCTTISDRGVGQMTVKMRGEWMVGWWDEGRGGVGKMR